MTKRYIGGLPGKRVENILGAIDSGIYDFVLTECDALAAKYPKSPFPLVLKGIALQKQGARDESLNHGLTAKKMLLLNFGDNVDNYFVLSKLRYLFCQLEQWEMGLFCYEMAVRLVPDDLELVAGLFQCYVAAAANSLDQEPDQIARKLDRGDMIFPWCVCSQVLCANDGDGTLPLAETFLDYHISSTGLVGNEALKVYLFCLEKQQKYKDALAIVEKHSESSFESEHFKLCLQGRFLAKRKRYTEAANAFSQALQKCPDNLEYFLQYLGALLEDDCFYTERICAKPPQESTKQHNLHLSDVAFNSRMLGAADLVETLHPQKVQLASRDNFIELDSESISFSRYCLAQLEIERCKLLFGKGDADEFVEKLMNHFTRFGHWTCFISDIKLFLDVLDEDRKTKLLEKISECPEVDSTIIAFGQSISKLKLQNMIDNMGPLSVKDLQERAVQIIHVFFKGLLLSKDLSLAEKKNNDDILSLAFNIFVMIFRGTGHIEYMVKATVLMDLSLTIRSSLIQHSMFSSDVIQHACSLVSMYSYWNCHTLAYKCYKDLKIENILLEPISEKFIPQMLASLPWSDDLGIFLSDCKNFIDNQIIICGDAAYRAFHSRAYSTDHVKGMSHMQFKDGLQRSVIYAILRIETSISKLKQDSYDIDKLEVTLEAEGCGNPCLELAYEMEEKAPIFSEDLKKPHPCIGPTIDETYLLEGFQGASLWQQDNADYSPESFKENMLKALKQRSLVPRLLYLSTCSAAAAASEEVEIPEIRRNLNELKALLDRYAETLGFSFGNAVELLCKVACGEKRAEELGHNVLQWLTFAVFLNAWNLSSRQIDLPSINFLREVSFSVTTVLNMFIVNWIKNAKTSYSQPGRSMYSILQVVTEPLSWHGVILQCFGKNINMDREGESKGLLVATLKYSSTLFFSQIKAIKAWAKKEVSDRRTDLESQPCVGVYGMQLILEEKGMVEEEKISKLIESLDHKMTTGQGFELDDDPIEVMMLAQSRHMQWAKGDSEIHSRSHRSQF